jgi:CNT family concentrative nucleoside transporter
MALYASILSRVIPDAIGHILIASIISTPAAIAVSILMVPSGAPVTQGTLVPTQAATSSASGTLATCIAGAVAAMLY